MNDELLALKEYQHVDLIAILPAGKEEEQEICVLSFVIVSEEPPDSFWVALVIRTPEEDDIAYDHVCVCCVCCVFVVCCVVYLLYLLCICCICCMFVVLYLLYLLWVCCICCVYVCVCLRVCCVQCSFSFDHRYPKKSIEHFSTKRSN